MILRNQNLINYSSETGANSVNIDLDSSQTSHSARTLTPKLIAIAGGKGGTGKSFFAANVGIALTRRGYRVALVDLDLGAANLHTCLGIPSPKLDLFDFMNNRVERLEDIAVPTGVENMQLFGGGQEFWQQIRPQSVQKVKIISRLQKLDADYVIVDLGAGTHTTTQDFFIFSHSGIVVVLPEPTSIENTYVFLKGILSRRIETIVKSLGQENQAQSLLESLRIDPKISAPPMAKLSQFAQSNPELGGRLLDLIRKTQIGIIINQVRAPADIDIGHSMAQICQKYFGFDACYIGPACYDDAVWRSVRNRRPIFLESPSSQIAQDIDYITQNLTRQFCPAARQLEPRVES